MRRIIVNQDDVIIGHKSRNEMDFSNDIYRVSAVWLINDSKEVLIAQRSLSDSNGAGLWGPSAAGTVEEGETYDQNIAKELEEELGVERVDLVFIEKVFNTIGRQYFCQVYLGKTNIAVNDFRLQPSEVEAVKWVSISELAEDSREHSQKYVPGMLVSVELLDKHLRLL